MNDMFLILTIISMYDAESRVYAICAD